MAVVSGANAVLSPTLLINLSKAGMLSPDGRCKAFDASANGFVRGEGAGAVILKPLARALSDGDPVYAVIRGTAVNSDGRSTGMTVPNLEAQERVILEALAWADVAPRDVSYVEAHGTGTPLGDPIEARALANVLSIGREEPRKVALGSVKTNVGHLESASGIAGVVKTALCLKHGEIPPSLHFRTPNPAAPLGSLLNVQTELGPWPAGYEGRIAGINSFGFGGTNAHVVLEAAPPEAQSLASQEPPVERPHVLPISARSAESLDRLLGTYADRLRQTDDSVTDLRDVCYTAGVRRAHHDHRFVAVGRSRDALVAALAGASEGPDRALVRGTGTSERPPKLAFVFSGQGTQWWAMGRELLEREPVFRIAFQKCDQIFQEVAGGSLLSELRSSEADSRLEDTEIAQPVLFALQVALATLWRSFGVVPDAVVGHSVGEVAAAHIAGILSLDDAVRIMHHRGRSMQSAKDAGRMLAVHMTLDEATRLLEGFAGRVVVAAINGTSALTLSGETEALDEIRAVLTERDVVHQALSVRFAFHSPIVQPAVAEVREALRDLKPREALIPMVSTVTGNRLEGDRFDAEYWGRNVGERVRFLDGIDALFDEGILAFIEVGPHPALVGSVLQRARERGLRSVALPSLRREEDEQACMLTSLARLYAAGYPVDWRRLYPERRRHVPLPAYAWAHKRFWVDADEEAIWEGAWRGRSKTTGHPLVTRIVSSAHPGIDVKLDVERLPYLASHNVQGSVLAPATLFLEAALAASRVSAPGGADDVRLGLSDVQLQKALFLAKGAPTRLQVVLVPEQRGAIPPAFHVYGASEDASNGAWALHATGRVAAPSALPDAPAVEPGFVERVRRRTNREKTASDFYATLKRVGMRYGPEFQGVDHVWANDDEAVARIVAPEGIRSELDAYHFHPALLDACLQVLAAVIPGAEEAGAIYLPVRLEAIRVYGKPGVQSWCYVHTTDFDESTGFSVEGDALVLDDLGRVLAEVKGLRAQRVDSDELLKTRGVDPTRWLYEIAWEPQVRPGEREILPAADFTPAPGPLASALEEAFGRLTDSPEFRKHCDEAARLNRDLCRDYILGAFRTLGWTLREEEEVRLDDLQERLAVAPPYRRLLRFLLRVLVKQGFLVEIERGWRVIREHDPGDPEATGRAFMESLPDFEAELTLLRRCGARLADVLRGTSDPLQLLFPEGSFEDLERLYRDTVLSRLYNGLVEEAVARTVASLPRDRTIRVLELGAGTGSTTSCVLPRLPPHRTEYVFSDVSNLFLMRAEGRFSEFPFVTYETLDIERDPVEQGFEPHRFDLVIAANVLHATSDLRAALGNVKRLLNSEGLLLLWESTEPAETFILLFGLLQELWGFEDDLRAEHMLLAQERWCQLLREEGFTDAASVPLAEGATRDPIRQAIVLARGPELSAESERQELPELEEREPPGLWLVLGRDDELTGRIASRLEELGEVCAIAVPADRYEKRGARRYTLAPLDPEGYRELLASAAESHGVALRGIVHLWGVEGEPTTDPSTESLGELQERTCLAVRELLRAVESAELEEAPRLWLVTRGAQHLPSDTRLPQLGSAPLWALGRTVAIEHWQISCRNVDLPPEPQADEAEWLVRELWAESPENQVAFRAEGRFVKRLIPESAGSGLVTGEAEARKPADSPFRLEVDAPGTLESLSLREAPAPRPGRGEVVVRVEAAALNFRDVMKALGIYPLAPGEPLWLGDECAGRVVEVGEGARFRPGDEVIVVGPSSFRSLVTAREEALIPKPEGWTFGEAAALPTAFLTSYYALDRLARLRRGERVLIHAASGGVGLAAVQLAQRAGAEVYATAGSDAKREFLRSLGVEHVMDSRSLAFAEEILRSTKGEGVDVVLNSLSGEAMAKSLSTLGAHGRFLEIGKRDIYGGGRLSLGSFKKNQSFHAIDLAQVFQEEPDLIRGMMGDLLGMIERDEIRPLPVREFPIADAVSAFRFMSQAKHIGKVVLAFSEQEVSVKPPRDRRLELSAESTYLVTGGLGGFGLEVARFLVDRGARHLVLAGRSGADRPEAAKAVAEMRERGVEVLVARADVSDRERVASLLDEVRRLLPPLKGIVHSAMVLDDVPLLEMTDERFWSVFRPKAWGAWHLHELTRNVDLDFFLLLSSASSVLGAPGQANYGAANEFLSTLAHYRRVRGLPATAVNLGRLGEVGYVAEHPQVAEVLDRYGILALPLRSVLSLLERILVIRPAQIGLMETDWGRLRTLHPEGLDYPLLTRLGKGSRGAAGKGRNRLERAELVALAPERRQAKLEEYIRFEIARVLQLEPAGLDVSTPLNALGLDSLVGIELKARLETDLEFKMPMTLLMQGPSISRLAEEILKTLSGDSEETVPRPLEEGEIDVDDEAPSLVAAPAPGASENEAASEEGEI